MESKMETQIEARALETEDSHVHEVVRAAHAELQELLHKRSEIMQRIGTVKRTIVGLATVFGKGVVEDDWLESIDGKRKSTQPGFTKTCRMILMEADGPLTAREVSEGVKARLDQVELRHKDLLASVTTVLNRLSEYGEAKSVTLENGRRGWQWQSDILPINTRRKSDRDFALKFSASAHD